MRHVKEAKKFLNKAGTGFKVTEEAVLLAFLWNVDSSFHDSKVHKERSELGEGRMLSFEGELWMSHAVLLWRKAIQKVCIVLNITGEFL